LESLPPKFGGSASSSAPPPKLSTPASWPQAAPGYSPALANRSAEFNGFVSILQVDAKARAVFFEGPANHGKTMLVKECRKYAEHVLSPSACVTIDFKNGSSKRFVLETIQLQMPAMFPGLTASTPQVSDLRAAIHELSQPVVFFIDAYEKASDEARELVELMLGDIRRLPNVRLMLAGQDVPNHEHSLWVESVAHIEVLPITNHLEWKGYASQYLGDVDAAHVEGLTLATKGVPGIIRPFLEALVKEAAE
jgi:hypothetical protein